ncbi:hypothetical protein ACSEU6_29940, partial [Pseudomonas aeruginosa]
ASIQRRVTTCSGRRKTQPTVRDGLTTTVDTFLSSQAANLNKKLGAKIGEGRLPYEASRAGVEQAKLAVKETLENATAVSDIIPKSAVRGDYDLVHVYSSKTNSTVSLRVLPGGKYEFDTLISEKSSKF